MSLISPAPGGCLPPARRSIRNSPPTTPMPSPQSSTRAASATALRRPWHAGPIVGGLELAGAESPVFDPSDHRRRIGTVAAAGPEAIEQALARAARAAPSWTNTPAEIRAAALERAADLYE